MADKNVERVTFGIVTQDGEGLRIALAQLSSGQSKTINHGLSGGMPEEWRSIIENNGCRISHTGVGSFTVVKS